MMKDNNMPFVSIITVSYNSKNTIRKTIESVLHQTYSNFEYRIIDGLSNDGTVDIAYEYNKQFEERGIKYYIKSERDKGIYDAMNKGIEESRGEIIGIINSDDWYEKDALENVINKYRNTSFDYYYANINLIFKNGKVIQKKSKKDNIATSRHWNHPSCFVKKSIYNELGKFNCTGIHDDFDFFLRVRKNNKHICVDNKVIANFRVGGESNERNLYKCIQRCKDRYKCYRNNGYNRLYLVECILMEIAKFISV